MPGVDGVAGGAGGDAEAGGRPELASPLFVPRAHRRRPPLGGDRLLHGYPRWGSPDGLGKAAVTRAVEELGRVGELGKISLRAWRGEG